MGKKPKPDAPAAPSSIPNRELFQRLNFLYQSAAYLEHVSNASSSNRPDMPPDGSLSNLSRSYVKSMKTIGKRALVKIDPAVKRTVCKACDTVLVPGTTASVRIKPSRTHGNRVVTTCLRCKNARSIPRPPELRSELPGSSKLPQNPSSNPAPETELSAELTPNEHEAFILGKRRPPAKHPPFFERDVGHVVFRGNEVIDN